MFAMRKLPARTARARRKVARLRIVFAAVSVWAGMGNLPAHADYPVAPDVVVFCEPTLRAVITNLGAQWRKETGIPVRIFTAPTWANVAQLAHHTRDDVIIGEGDAAAASATAQHLIRGDTVVRLWRNHLVVAAPADERASLDLASVAGSAPVAIVDPRVAEAGLQTEAALKRLGLWDSVKGKSISVVDTADAAFLLAEGTVKLAVLYATDVIARPDLAVASTLPADAQPIVYWAAQTEHALSPNTAKFLDFLRRVDIRAQGRDAGLEVLP
jgi:molybdate transport system substrate-binding protein